MTRGDVLRYAVAFALMRARKIVRGLKVGLTEDERYAVADHVVYQLKKARRRVAIVRGNENGAAAIDLGARARKAQQRSAVIDGCLI
jgi:hypothetical protein